MSVPRRSLVRALLVVALAPAVLLTARHARSAATERDLADEALNSDLVTSINAIEALRARGQAGADALLTHADSPALERVLDAVCAQKDCESSHLFWYTDLEKAKAEAHASHRPILSLRLLGRLDDDWSCANSRFFRTLLYTQPALADYLRTHFVLHWESVRPVPRATIDFGDGRKVETTVTGNSIHYVLDEQGRVVDALPGLYGPTQFHAELERAETVALQTEGLPEPQRVEQLAAYHRQRFQETSDRWAREMHGYATNEPLRALPTIPVFIDPAAFAMNFAVTKAVIERPIVRQVTASSEALEQYAIQIERLLDDPIWTAIAQRHITEFAFAPESEAVVRRRYLARVPAATPDQVSNMLRRLQLSVATDTERNEFLLRQTLHGWLSAPVADLHELNDRVYAELFHTPSSDPWLGLVDEGVFDALPDPLPH